MYERFFDLQNEISLCWRSKSIVRGPGSEIWVTRRAYMPEGESSKSNTAALEG